MSKSFQDLKKEMDLQVKSESVMHDHRDSNNWLISSTIVDYSTEATIEKQDHPRKAKVTDVACKVCGEDLSKTVKPLESTKPKVVDKPVTVKKSIWRW